MNKQSSNPNILSPEDMLAFCIILFNIILRYDEQLRLTTIEAIRRMLQNPNPTHPWTPVLQETLRSLLDGLLVSPDPDIVARVSRSPVRPVEKK